MSSSTRSDVATGVAWRAFHLYMPHSTHTRFLRDAVAPILRSEGFTDRFFFLRYWQGGPHLRIRLLHDGTDTSSRAIATVRAKLADAMPAATDELLAEYQLGASLQDELARRERAAALPPRPAGTVDTMPYTPESVKYGGPAGIAIAEEVFRATSREVLSMLENARTADPEGTRAPIGEAVRVVAMSLRGARLGRDEAMPFLDSYVDWWDGYADERARALRPRAYDRIADRVSSLVAAAAVAGTGDDPIVATVRRATDAARSAAGADSATRPGAIRLDGTPYLGCLSNYIHTTNNRLGLVPAAEALVADLVRRGIRDAGWPA